MGITTNTKDLRRLLATSDYCFRLACLDAESMDDGGPPLSEGLSAEACEEICLDDGQKIRVRLHLHWDVQS